MAHYRTGPGYEPTAERYHQLALTTMSSLENLHDVAKYLAEQFGAPRGSDGRRGMRPRPTSGRMSGMTRCASITTAPNRLIEADAERREMGAASDLPRDPWDVVQRMDRTGGRDDHLRVITRLVAARWLFNDLLFDPQREERAPAYGGVSEACPDNPR